MDEIQFLDKVQMNNGDAKNSFVVPKLDLSFSVNLCNMKTKNNLENIKKENEDLFKIKFAQLKISRENLAKNLKRKLSQNPKNYFNIVDLLREQKVKCSNAISQVRKIN